MHYFIQGWFGIIRPAHPSLRRHPRQGGSSFANHLRSLFIIAHGDEGAMSLRYLLDEPFQRRIGAQINKGEALHALR